MGKAERDISPEELRNLLSYDRESGLFTWRERSVACFTASQKWSADQLCRRWNTRYSGKVALGGNKGNGYLHGPVLGKYLLAHRAAWAFVTGSWPVEQIDHINGIRSDNRFSNLRQVSAADNARNMRGPGKGEFGVQPYLHGKWIVRIRRNGRNDYLGIFETKEDAISARLNAEREADYHENHGGVANA